MDDQRTLVSFPCTGLWREALPFGAQALLWLWACTPCCPKACGVLVPQPEMEPVTLAWEGGFLTFGLPGKPSDSSLKVFLLFYGFLWFQYPIGSEVQSPVTGRCLVLSVAIRLFHLWSFLTFPRSVPVCLRLFPLLFCLSSGALVWTGILGIISGAIALAAAFTAAALCLKDRCLALMWSSTRVLHSQEYGVMQSLKTWHTYSKDLGEMWKHSMFQIQIN